MPQNHPKPRIKRKIAQLTKINLKTAKMMTTKKTKEMMRKTRKMRIMRKMRIRAQMKMKMKIAKMMRMRKIIVMKAIKYTITIHIMKFYYSLLNSNRLLYLYHVELRFKV